MPHFFFHLRTDTELVDDLFGTEFADIDAARLAAIDLARNLRIEQATADGPDCIQSIEICEAEGDVLGVVIVKLPADGSAT
ncbi:MAG: hypothetical protein JWM58_699 [Rhizobium sp.]|nr:hypothetical protein [Rhizobium sp.]